MYKIFVPFIVFLTLFTGSYCNTTGNNTSSNIVNEKIVGKTFTRTYHVYNIADSNDFKYVYITIRAFQEEEIETVKVTRDLVKKWETNDYEFTFQVSNGSIEDNIKSIFNNSDVVDVKKTDKTGLEQKNDELPQ